MQQYYQEIAERDHRLQNPLDDEKLMLLGQVCGLRERMRLLDLACGKGELLARWANAFGVIGVGVDASETFIGLAKDRAYTLDVPDHLTFVVDDPATYPQAHHAFDVVCCLNASSLGGFSAALALMQTALTSRDGLLVVGEAFWQAAPPEATLRALQLSPEAFATLPGTLARCEAAGLELVEMVIADAGGWDRYEAQQWMAVNRHLREHPDDPHREALRDLLAENRRAYLSHVRPHMGWGAFVLRV